MSTFSIVTDTGCDMPSALAEKLKVSAVPLKVIVAGKETDSSLKKLDIDNSGFYDIIRKGIDVKTSSPSLEDFLRYFKKELNKGKDILYIGFSTGLSGTYNVGRIAAE
ncbi:MAG: DegV family protein, partial [Clostridia bacterium]|nr:DegV family protein [Clostridia bacterium]